MTRLAAATLTAAGILAASGAWGQQRTIFDTANRFLDGSVDASKAKLKPSIFMIDSFEDPQVTGRDWTFTAATTEPSDQNVTEGRKSLKLVLDGREGQARYRRGTAGWGDAKTEDAAAWSLQLIFHDEVRLDVFNAESRSVKLVVTMGKPFSFDLKPGKNEIAIKTRDMVDAVYRATMILGAARIAVEDDKPVALYLDNFRWAGPISAGLPVAHPVRFEDNSRAASSGASG
jgi:hypothetical protein